MKVTKEMERKIREDAGKLSMQWVKSQSEPFAVTLTDLAFDFAKKILEKYDKD